MSPDDTSRPDGIRLAVSSLAHSLTVAAKEPARRNRTEVDVDALSGPLERGDPARPLPVLVSLHYLRAALRRKRAVWLLGALLGLVAGAAFPAIAPASRTASATLYLSHDPRIDPGRAMGTDVSLLSTRVLAQRTIDTLGLTTTPDDLLRTLTSVPTTSDLLMLSMEAPTAAEAERRLGAFTRIYLDLRGTQISAQSDALIRGDNERIAALRAQSSELSRRISVLAGVPDDGSGQLNDLLTQRAQITSQINTLQEAVQDETLRRSAIVAASRVLDPPAAEPVGGMRKRVLYGVSGLVGGLGAGLAAVVFMAIMTDRLRLRVEVAAALEAPVKVSTGRLTRRSGRRRLLPRARARSAQRTSDLRRLAYAVQQDLAAHPDDRRLAVAALDDPLEACLAVGAAALELHGRVPCVHLVDLTASGALQSTVAQLAREAGAEPPAVVRPGSIPSLAATPTILTGTSGDDAGEGIPPTLGPRDVVLVAADVDVRVGADHLHGWCERVMVAVASGRSSAERVRTAGDVIRAAGLQLTGGLLIGAEPRDQSSGAYPLPPAGFRSRPGDSPGTTG